MTHIQTKAFLLTVKALCADKPLSSLGFLRTKLVARFAGVGAICDDDLDDAGCSCCCCCSSSDSELGGFAVGVGVVVVQGVLPAH